MKFYDCIQNSEEWLELRKGHFTASSFSDLFMKPDTAAFNDCISKVHYERHTGYLLPEKNFSSKDTENGHIREPIARELYEMETFTKVKNGGFFELNDWIGCSPDGLIGEDGLLQIKCPKYSTIFKYKKTGELPIGYRRQMQGELWVTGRKWTDYFVYYERIEPFIIHLERDEKLISEIESKVNEAIEIVKSYL